MAESAREDVQRARRMIRLLWLVFFLAIIAVLLLTLWTWWREQQGREVTSVWSQEIEGSRRDGEVTPLLSLL